ncbi:MAG: hypothetical protein K0R44_1547 [Thermomicrobiales bacterium]|nr:hypothetical protein [Thermomicrobiales bacterium]
MSNTILTPTAVTRESLRIFHQKLNFIGSINRQYDDSFAKSGAKIGDTLKIREPNQYVVRTGKTLDTQDTSETSQTLTVATQKGVDLNFSSVDLTLSLDDFSKRILDPAMSVLAAAVEADAMSMKNDVYNAIHDNSNAITYADVLDGRVLLQRNLAPTGSRTANMSSVDMADLVKDTKTLFNHGGEIGKQYKDITSGTASIVVTTGSGTFVVGDIITVEGVYSVHPESKASTGVLQPFVVTAASAGGSVTLSVSPTPVTSGARQNVTIVSAGASKAVTVSGAADAVYTSSLLYQEDAFTFATADLVMPSGVDFARREVMDGISLRIVRQYDINNDNFPCRLDVLYGYKTLRPGHATRLHFN